MISMTDFSIFNIILATFSLITTTLALLYCIRIYSEKNTKILLLYAGIMLGFIINITAVLMGLVQIFIYQNYHDVPHSYCVAQGYIKTTGTALFNICQIIIDSALYLNIHHYEIYKWLFHDNIIQVSIYVYSSVVIFCAIFIIFGVYGPTNPFIDIDCSMMDLGGLSLSYLLIVLINIVLPAIAFLFDLFVIIRIIQFYRQYKYQLSIRKRINALILFPIVYSLVTTSEFMSAYFKIQSHKYPAPSIDSTPTTYTTKMIIQGVCFILISSRGGMIACVFANLIVSSQFNEQKFEFTLENIETQSEFQDSKSLQMVDHFQNRQSFSSE